MNDRLPTVAVLMSTYNGEKYIREQLNSIFNQQKVNVQLFIRDDGSSDSTIKILEEYSQKYPIEINVDGENIRAGESFLRLVYKYADVPEIDYFAFADQDDIWLPEKLIVAIGEIKKYDKNMPILYSSNQYLYINGENKGNRHKEPQRTDLISHITKNTISGCTFVFNKALAQLVSKADKPDPRVIRYRIHDAWLMLVAIVCGRVIYDETSHMLYRIHNNNTVGIKKISLLTRIDKLKRFFIKRDDANLRMITAQEILRLFKQIDDDTKKVLRLFADYQKSWRDKCALAFNNEIRKNCAENPNMFTIKVLMNFV